MYLKICKIITEYLLHFQENSKKLFEAVTVQGLGGTHALQLQMEYEMRQLLPRALLMIKLALLQKKE